jgi:hypothetical protein
MLLTLLLGAPVVSDGFAVLIYSLLAIGALMELGVAVLVIMLKWRGKLT